MPYWSNPLSNSPLEIGEAQMSSSEIHTSSDRKVIKISESTDN